MISDLVLVFKNPLQPPNVQCLRFRFNEDQEHNFVNGGTEARKRSQLSCFFRFRNVAPSTDTDTKEQVRTCNLAPKRLSLKTVNGMEFNKCENSQDDRYKLRNDIISC